MPDPKHFKSKEAYNKYVAHIHIADIPHKQGKPVYIGGKLHKPNTSREKCPNGYCQRHGKIHY